MESKDSRIHQLEQQVAVLTRSNTPAATPATTPMVEDRLMALSLPLYGQSDA